MESEKVTWLKQALASMNPWWRGNADALGVQGLIPRSGFDDTLASVRGDLVTSLTGPRQVGKTTMLRQCIRTLVEDEGVDPRNVLFLDMDTAYLTAGLDRPLNDLFDVYSSSVLGRDISAGPETVYVILDEVCGLPDWERVVKGWQDARAPVKLIISDSSMTTLGRGQAKALTGRVSIIRLGPATLADWTRLSGVDLPVEELHGAREMLVSALSTGDQSAAADAISKAHSILYPLRNEMRAALDDYLVWGGYPGLADKGARERADRLRDIVDLTLLRDVAEENNVREVDLLRDFAAVICRQTGGVLSITNIAKDLGRDRWILTRFLDHLVEAGIVLLSKQYTGPHRSSARKERKVHVVTPGFANELAAALDPSAVIGTERANHLAESAMSVHSMTLEGGHLGIWGRAPRFWRRKPVEVDIVIEPGGVAVPIEVKYGRGDDAERGVRAFMEEWNAPLGIVAHMGDLRLDASVLYVPLWVLMAMC
jgi:predicted AAA+ superfamily ATPase